MFRVRDCVILMEDKVVVGERSKDLFFQEKQTLDGEDGMIYYASRVWWGWVCGLWISPAQVIIDI
jgi:hypothetical protein